MKKEIRVIDKRPMIVGESPLWDEEKNLLYTVDFRGKCIRVTDIYTLESIEKNLDHDVSAVSLCADGNLLVAMEDGVYYMQPEGNLVPFWVPEKLKGRRLNDGKVGPDGKYYVGSKDADHEAALYCCDISGSCREVLAHVGSSNGSAWSEDGKKFYYCDTMDMEICSFDFDVVTGELKNRRTVIAVPDGIGEFDGMTIDSEDKLWVAAWGAGCVYRIDPENGQVLQRISFPVSKVSSCAFAGEDLKTLIVTSASIRTDMDKEPLAGCTFAVDVDIPGRIGNRFGCKK